MHVHFIVFYTTNFTLILYLSSYLFILIFVLNYLRKLQINFNSNFVRILLYNINILYI